MKKTASSRKVLPVLMHVSAWVVLIILPQIIINRAWGNSNYFAWGFYLNAGIYGIIFYINYIWLVPRFFFDGKKVVYFLSAGIVISFFYFFNSYVNAHFLHDPEREKAISEIFEKLIKDKVIQRPPMRQIQVYYFALISVVITGFAVGLRVIERHTASEKRQKELEKEKLNSELAFLKNQISPHFFFNTLNNIYSLIEIDTKDAQEAVLKLSKMMRYLLYESEHGETMLEQEILFLTHYIDLMKLRLTDKVDLKIDLPTENIGYKIPPLLFIPFVENAFKHGISYREKSYISISMKIENSVLFFTCSNSLGSSKNESLDKSNSGIGLENVKKRLTLLFPKNHNLKIKKSDKDFNVFLEINFSSKQDD